MIDKVRKYVEKYHMIAEGDTVIVGVSGGADSVCLLLILLQLREIFNFSVRVVHVEHGIRGGESIADAEFVKELCDKKNVECVQYHFDIPRIAKERRMSEEETGRQLRYEVFEKEADYFPQAKIAVAHHRNDNVETMLHNLVRGSHVAGLAGIPPVRGRIIRPLLLAERDEIEAYLEEKGQEYRTDTTNFEMVYTRNRIRREIVPGLQKINPAAVSHMAKTAEILREVQEYLESQAKQQAAEVITEYEEGVRIDIRGMDKLPGLLRDQILYQVLTKLARSHKDIEEKHIEKLWQLAEKQVGRQMHLPYGLVARKEYDGLWVGMVTGEKIESETQEISVYECKEFTCYIFDYSLKNQEIPKNKYTKWFDYDKIKDSLCIRNRRPGDYFYLEEAGRVKKLKQYFIDEKIPKEQRDRILLLADGSHIVWIVGYRISAYYKITEHTERILEVQYGKASGCEGDMEQAERNGGNYDE